MISEHSDVLILSHRSFAAVDLADSESGHAPPDHQGASPMLNCGDNALWAVSLPYSPPHKSLLCPTEQLKGTFIGP